MEIDKIIVTLGGILASLFTYWYFLDKAEQGIIAKDSITILVDGGYQPGVITIPANQTIRLDFIRKDPSSCLEEVVLPDFGKRVYLPLNQTTSIELRPEKVGEYEISCGMNMFHGKIVVQEL